MNKDEILYDKDLVIENDTIKLRIVSLDDIDQLKEIAFNSSIWTYFIMALTNEKELIEYVEGRLADHSRKMHVPFVIIDKRIDKIVGMSSFGNISMRDRRIEIGWSWIAPEFQGTGVNTIYKHLLVNFAFEKLDFIRVEFKTDVLNLQARRALTKIGATEEGVLRSHTLMQHNRWRDTIFYSILREEWS